MGDMKINHDALVMGQPLYFDGIGYVEQPLVSEMSLIGYDNYAKLLSPLFLQIDEDEHENVALFDVFFMKGNEQLLQALINSLAIFLKKDIQIVRSIIQIGDAGFIDCDNFKDFQLVVMAMLGISPPKKEDLSNLNPKQLEVKKKLEYHRKRHADKNRPTFKEIINTVVHRGHFSYKEVNEMSYYQLLNSYLVVNGLSAYDEYVMYKASPKFEMKDDMEHWTKTIKKI